MKEAITHRWVLFHEKDARFARLVDVKKVQITDTTPYLPDALLMHHHGYFPNEVLEVFGKFGWKVQKVSVELKFVES